jgi:hypothetical protein
VQCLLIVLDNLQGDDERFLIKQDMGQVVAKSFKGENGLKGLYLATPANHCVFDGAVLIGGSLLSGMSGWFLPE